MFDVNRVAGPGPLDLVREAAYHISRQEHLGDALDRLRDMGLLSWRWEYVGSSAFWWIAVGDQRDRRFDTRSAEQQVQRLFDEHGIVWRPVPHPGGADQLRETQAWIATASEAKDGSTEVPR